MRIRVNRPHAFDCRKCLMRNHICNVLLENLAARNSDITDRFYVSPIRNRIHNLQSAEPLFCFSSIVLCLSVVITEPADRDCPSKRPRLFAPRGGDHAGQVLLYLSLIHHTQRTTGISPGVLCVSSTNQALFAGKALRLLSLFHHKLFKYSLHYSCLTSQFPPNHLSGCHWCVFMPAITPP